MDCGYQHFACQWKSIFKVWFHLERGPDKYIVSSSSDLSGPMFRETTPVSADQVLSLPFYFPSISTEKKTPAKTV